MEKVLVTGATGFVGSHLVQQLLNQGFEVRALVRNPEQLGALRNADAVEIFPGDVTQSEAVNQATQGVSIVFHLAAVVHFWGKYKKQMQTINIQGTQNVVQACLRSDVQRLVYMSTAAVIKRLGGGQMSHEKTLTSRQDMIGPYEQTKYDAEQIVLNAVTQGLDVVVLNPPGPIGPFDVKPSPMGKVIVDFLNGKIPAYTHTGLNVVAVEDIALGTLLAAEKGATGERYILGGYNYRFIEFLELLAKISGKKAPRFRVPYSLTLVGGLFGEISGRLFKTDPIANLHSVRMAKHEHWYDNSKAIQELGFNPRPIQPFLESAIDWFQKNNYIH
ncbi:MAG: NAD-dependent epimerase/dehydratase family protein [Planctomycetota bacterium]